jgi:hypothetical protein
VVAQQVQVGNMGHKFDLGHPTLGMGIETAGIETEFFKVVDVLESIDNEWGLCAGNQ